MYIFFNWISLRLCFLSEIPGGGGSHCKLLSGVKSSQEIHEVGRRIRISSTGTAGNVLSGSPQPASQWDCPPLVSMYLSKHKHILLGRQSADCKQAWYLGNKSLHRCWAKPSI